MKKFLWVESYAPTTVDDCILPDSIKKPFLKYVKEKEFPNLILAGPAGVGKTSVAKALCTEIDADLLFINASLDRGIGEVRTNVAQFASTASMIGSKKVVFLDEADNLTQDSQKALRALIEEFQNHCRFILTCNFPHNLIEAIHSRCTVFDFHIRGESTRKKLSGEFGMRLVHILKENSIEFDPKVLVRFVTSRCPDWRSVLNTIQGNIVDGKLSDSIVNDTTDTLVELIKHKKWQKVQEWLFEHSYVHPKQIERELYWTLQSHLTNDSKPQAVVLFGQYTDKILRGADPFITLLALCTEVMMGCEFK